ncbi:MAG: helix-turn-helix transcriptional regulator [Bacillota bacterium]|nr:helix-turn-helix transcriptional regulator [Bacillota bacterium]
MTKIDNQKTLKSTAIYLKEIGEKIKLYRVSKGLTQQQLEEKTGVSARSISRLEQGQSIHMDSFVKILCALNLEDNLSMLIPDQRDRPSFYLKKVGNPKYRARKKAHPQSTFVWGEDK